MHRTVIDDGHKMLYHWQSFNVGEVSESRLKKSLQNNTIYCSSPGSFNDPWDCTPCFNWNVLDDHLELNKFVEWLSEASRMSNGNKSNPIDEAKINSYRKSPDLAKRFVRENLGQFASIFHGQYRVYCLGPDVENILMWSHYADSHRGICLEFSLNNNLLCNALSCEYYNEYPIMRLHERDLKPILAKSFVWGYEKEYRIVAQEHSHNLISELPITKNGFLKIPEGALKSIIVGCRGDFKTVNRLVNNFAPTVQVKQAVQVANRYAIRI